MNIEPSRPLIGKLDRCRQPCYLAAAAPYNLLDHLRATADAAALLIFRSFYIGGVRYSIRKLHSEESGRLEGTEHVLDLLLQSGIVNVLRHEVGDSEIKKAVRQILRGKPCLFRQPFHLLKSGRGDIQCIDLASAPAKPSNVPAIPNAYLQDFPAPADAPSYVHGLPQAPSSGVGNEKRPGRLMALVPPFFHGSRFWHISRILPQNPPVSNTILVSH